MSAKSNTPFFIALYAPHTTHAKQVSSLNAHEKPKHPPKQLAFNLKAPYKEDKKEKQYNHVGINNTKTIISLV